MRFDDVHVAAMDVTAEFAVVNWSSDLPAAGSWRGSVPADSEVTFEASHGPQDVDWPSFTEKWFPDGELPADTRFVRVDLSWGRSVSWQRFEEGVLVGFGDTTDGMAAGSALADMLALLEVTAADGVDSAGIAEWVGAASHEAQSGEFG
jgi:hypothetical protein